jgi:hypothetical protein
MSTRAGRESLLRSLASVPAASSTPDVWPVLNLEEKFMVRQERSAGAGANGAAEEPK